MKKEVKQKLNHSIESVKLTCKTFERGLDKESICFAEDDVELIDNFFKLAIICEQKNRIDELKNDLFNLMQKYDTKEVGKQSENC